jgi:lipid-A-disaccharide synthase
MTRILISCGEASGDLYAGALARELLALDPGLTVTGFGGERLQRAGVPLIGDYHGISVTGLVEVLRVLPRTWAMYRRLVASATRDRPDVFVAVDFPDFNFRLGLALRRLGVRVVYYISPQLWAWRPKRLDTMQRFVDRALVIFPFEVPIYERAGIPVEFVGHPLVDLLDPAPPRDEFLRGVGLDPAAATVALLPGSRANEVRLILPVLLDAAARLATRDPRLQFVIARAPRLDDTLFASARHAADRGLRLAIVESATDAVLANADATVTASGTATVQTALHGCPMVIVYRLSPLTYALGVRFVKVDTYGMVNLVAGRRVVPELMQDDCTAGNIVTETERLLRDPAHAAATRAALDDVRQKLGGPGASRRAAEAVLRVASTRR